MKLRTAIKILLLITLCSCNYEHTKLIREGYYLDSFNAEAIVEIRGNEINSYVFVDSAIALGQGKFILQDSILIVTWDLWKYSKEDVTQKDLNKTDTIELTIDKKENQLVIKGCNFKGDDKDLESHIQQKITGVATKTYLP